MVGNKVRKIGLVTGLGKESGVKLQHDFIINGHYKWTVSNTKVA